MTEQEAKTKWCPFARECSSDDEPVAYNRSGGLLVPCIASQCMAWRWTDINYSGRCGLVSES